MPPKPSPILGGFSTQRSPNAADNDAINLVVEIIETKDGKVPGYLYGMSGLDLLYTAGGPPIRGMLPLNDVLYVVSGSEVYSFTANGTKTLLGTVNGITTPVSMFQNTKQLLILDGSGAWLVPGGYPITGGVATGGSLYAVGDIVILEPFNGGPVTAFPQIQVTGISNNPATIVAPVNAGISYPTTTGAPTAPIQPLVGQGTGLTLDIFTVGGEVITFTGVTAGRAYAVGDTGAIEGGNRGASYQVLATDVDGGVTDARLLTPGGGYGDASNVATTRGVAFPPNTGTGLTLDIVAGGGPVTSITLANGGHDYTAGNVGFIDIGTGDATFIVNAVGGSGVITSFTILTGGAITSPAGLWTQQSTDGSGQNFELSLPGYGPFRNLVPIELPFDSPIAGVVIDGFGLAVFLNQQVIAQSNQRDLSTWPPLSFGVANQSPDNIISIAALHDEAYVFKERSTEVWANQGTSPFAFGPLQGVHIEFGGAAPFSPSKTDNDMIWLDRNDQGQGQFLKASAYAPQLISTQALTNELQKYANIADCIAYSRQEGGHTFYVATFPSANVTWCYDKTSSELVGFPIWTKMAAFKNGEFDRHWGNAFTTWSGGLPPITTTTTYQARSVTITDATTLDSGDGLNGLQSSFFTAAFSVWLYIPDGSASGIVFGNQQEGEAPGIQISIENDDTGSPQITVEAWDENSDPIVIATYDFSAWANWVNVLMSIDTATQRLQVWANTVAASELFEIPLTPASLTWSSTNPIAVVSAVPWSLTVVP